MASAPIFHVEPAPAWLATRPCWGHCGKEQPFTVPWCTACFSTFPPRLRSRLLSLAVEGYSSGAALRTVTLEQKPLPDLRPHRPLTPGDIAILRAQRPAPIDLGASGVGPTARYNRAGDTYEIVIGGTAICHCADLVIIAGLLRGERFEPGFIKRILDTAAPVDEAALTSADERERARHRRTMADAAARQREAAAAEAKREAAIPKRSVPDTLTIDDLFT